MRTPAGTGAEADDTAPSQRFEVRGALGSGGMGTVYRAFDHARHAEVALKLLRRGGALDVYRFKREFRALADIAHPNLVTLYELQTSGDEWFFTMELVEGEPFLRHVRPYQLELPNTSTPDPFGPSVVTQTAAAGDQRSPESTGAMLRERIIAAALQLDRLDAALYQLVDGVHALHVVGKLHRDLKPSNVLVEATGRVVLLDFGLVADIATSVHETHERTAGTPAYMSPEQAGDGALTEASDWYSVGVMLYEALTGRRPYEGATGDILTAKRTGVRPPPPGRLAAGIPAHLDRLCMALLDHDPGRRPDGRAIFAALGREPSTATTSLAFGAAPFVGRELELAALRSALVDSRGGGGTAVFVRGASGMGKSALLRRFLDEVAQDDDAIILEGRCYQRETVPYKALDTVIDALTSRLARLDDRTLRAVLPQDVTALARLFPVLRRVTDLAGAPMMIGSTPDPIELRRRAFAALRELLEQLGRRRTVVIAIDDLQWGDADSAAFLGELIHHPKVPPVLLVVCHRSEDDHSAVLTAVRGAATGDRRLRDVIVGALSDADAMALLAEIAPDPADQARARAIVRDCGGSPFFLTELARARDIGDAAVLRVDRVLQGHVDRLPAEARALLQLCALAARPLATHLALRAAGLDREGAAVAVLRVERLVRVRWAGASQLVEPYHDRIRETVVAALPGSTRRALHLALAQALEADGARDHESLAEHWLEAGEAARAGAHAAQAAAAAEEALAFHRAVALYELALTHADLDADARRTLQTRIGHALVHAGRLDEAAAAFGAAAATATDPEEVIDLRRLAIEQLLRGGDYDNTMVAVDDLLAGIGVRQPRSRAGLLASLLGQELLLKLRGKARTRTPRVPMTPAQHQRIQVLWSLSSGMAYINPVLGRVLQLHLVRDVLASGEKRYLGIVNYMDLVYVSSAGVKARPQREALRERGLALAAELDDATLVGWVEGASGIAAYLHGEYRLAQERLVASIEILRDRGVGVRWQLDIVQIFLTATLWQLGDTAELVRVVELFLRDAVDRGDRLAERGLRSWRSNAAWLVLGQPDEAEAQVDASLPTRQPGEAFQLRHYYEMLARSQIDLYRDAGAAARARVEATWRELERSMMLRVETVRIESWYLRGRCALAAAAAGAGDPASLLRVAERAARVIEKTRASAGAPLAASLRATVAHRRGQVEEARVALEAALAGFIAADMALFAAAAQHRFGEIIGGDHGGRLAAAATAVMTAGRVADPIAMTRLLLPGW